MDRRQCLLTALGAAMASGPAAADPLPQPGLVRPEPVVITNDYTEGVVVDYQANLYFSHGTRITRVSPDGKVGTWAETGAPNGHKVVPGGEHLVCDGSRNAVLVLSAEGKILRNAAFGRSGGLEIRTPNDLTLDAHGGFYFTDSVVETGAVHYVARDGTLRLIARELDFPNGIALTPDGKKLYLAESQKNRLLVLDVRAPGVVAGPPRLLIDLPRNEERPGKEWNQPDGMALDRDGRIWIAHYGMQAIHVVSPRGRLLATYDGGNRTTSNVCFAGPRFTTLYATGGEPGGLFRLEVGIPGVRLLR